jgi:hypothetical protein
MPSRTRLLYRKSMQMFRAAMLVDALHAAFEDWEEVFGRDPPGLIAGTRVLPGLRHRQRLICGLSIATPGPLLALWCSD